MILNIKKKPQQQMLFCCYVVVFYLLFSVFGYAVASERSVYQNALLQYDFLLKKTVTSAGVDYALLKKHQHSLNAYLYVLGVVNLNKLKKNEKLSLYINAYNAFTLRLILDYWPDIRSIKNIPDYPLPRRFKDKRWKLSGDLVSLNDIEHKYIKPMQEPLAYLAIVCATRSCPDLQAGVYKSSIINKQLIESAKRYLSQGKALKWGVEKTLFRNEKPVLYISELFRWKKDAIEFGGYSIPAFIEEFGPMKVKRFIAKHSDELSLIYLDYDWQLNASAR